MRKKLAAALCVLALFCAPTAGGEIYTFSPDDIPSALTSTALRVVEGETTVRLTFLGDCTLGGTTGSANYGKGFVRTVRERGLAYPFAKLLPLLSKDDLTVANLEGVLSENTEDKQKKEFNFIGSPEYAKILTLGSIECAGLSNNHALDFGSGGKADTVAALAKEGVAYFDDDTVTVLDKNGARVGVMGSLFGVDEAKAKRQIRALREAGCTAIIHCLHMGEEYARAPTAGQRANAKLLSRLGVSLVVGHHPHVAQGMEIFGHMPVVYSLGNACFGGNHAPKDLDAVLLQVEIRFSQGSAVSQQLTFWPISISGQAKRNDFQPRLLSGADAERVMKKLNASSGQVLHNFVENEGAKQPVMELIEELDRETENQSNTD